MLWFLRRLADARQFVSVWLRRSWRWLVDQKLLERFLEWMIPQITVWPSTPQGVGVILFFVVIIGLRVVLRLAEASASGVISVLSIGVYNLSYKLLHLSLRLYTLSVKLAGIAHGLRLPVLRYEE
jgi:hypothetical protein